MESQLQAGDLLLEQRHGAAAADQVRGQGHDVDLHVVAAAPGAQGPLEPQRSVSALGVQRLDARLVPRQLLLRL